MSTPLIRLHAGRRVLDAAEENCAHWEFDNLNANGSRHDCCDALRIARRAHKANLTAWRRQNQEPKP